MKKPAGFCNKTWAYTNEKTCRFFKKTGFFKNIRNLELI
jgi:hypothetical protein